MFNRKKNQETLVVFVSLSYKSLTIAYEEEEELKVASIEFDIQSKIDMLIKFWEKSIKQLLSKVSFKPYLVLLVNSSSFLVKNIQDIDSENVRYDYVSKQLDIPLGYFEMTHIQDNSYLVIKNSDIEKILFAFKDFNIKALYDLTIINSLYFLTKSSELYINVSLNSVDIVHNGSVFQKRGADKIFLKYLQKSATKLNLDLDSTYTHIKKNFSKIKSYQELMKSTQNGAVDLRGFIDDLVSYIENSLRYFNNYDAVDYIKIIYLDGDILELDFLADMLSEKLNLDEIIPVNIFLNLSDYKRTASTIAYRVDQDILDSSSIKLEGLRYSDGKQEYIFVDNTLVSQKKLTKEQKKRVLNFTRFVEIEESSNSHNSKYKKPDKSIWQMDATELFELAKHKLFSNTESTNSNSSKKSKDEDNETSKIILLIFLFLGGGIYYLWMYILDLEIDFDRKVNSYVSNMQSVDNAKAKLSSKETIYVDSGINKILWTEKFITIAKNMPDEIWFSSIRLENSEKEIEGKKVTSTRVVLDGRCLPSPVGHINTIAKYMENLMKSDDSFRRDFINVSFGGAESIFDEFSRNLISFQLYCNFRKNVNIEEIKSKVAPQKKSIIENIKSIKDNQKKQKEMLENAGKEK